MNFLNVTINLVDPVVTWTRDGSAGQQQTLLSLQTVRDGSEQAVATMELEMAAVFILWPLFTHI